MKGFWSLVTKRPKVQGSEVKIFGEMCVLSLIFS